MLDNVREKKPCHTQGSENTCYRLGFFFLFLFLFTRPYLFHHSRRSAFISVGGKNGYGGAAEQQQEVGSTTQQGVAALCWSGKKQSLLSAPTADVAVAWLFFVFFLFGVAADELAKGARDTAVSPFSSVELSHRGFLRKSGRSLLDLEPQSLLPFHAKKL